MSYSGLFSDLKVLLVDDERFIRRTTKHVLGLLDISNIIEAEDGGEALAALKNNEFDLLITDIQMPETNGIELVKQIRMGNASIDRSLRTLVVTSFSNVEVLGACLALDVNGFLVKPISAENATAKIHTALNEKTALRLPEAYIPVQSNLESLAETVKKESKKVNAAIFIDETKEAPSQAGEYVSLRNLKPGMKLLEDIRAQNGTILLTAGRMLTEAVVNRVFELESVIATKRLRVNSNPGSSG